jgi:MFS family permease
MTPTQRQVLTTTCLTHTLIHIYELSIPALLWMIQTEFGANDLRMGEIATFYALLFGVGSLPAGWLVDRIGSRPLLVVCLVGSSLCMVGMALSPSLALFALAAAGMGLCLSIYHPAGTALITHAMPPSGRVFAWHGMAGNTGVAGASAVAGLLGAWLGWRWALGLLALLGLVLAVRALKLPSPTVHEIRSRPGQGRWGGFVLLLIATAFMGMVYRGMTTFLPKFFAVSYSDELARGTAIGGVLTTVALFVGLAGMHTAGKLVDRGHHAAFVFLIGGTLQIPLLVAIRWIVGPALVPVFMGVAFFHFFTQPAGNKLVAMLTPPRMRGLGYGIYFLMTFGAGSFGGVIGGWISDHTGLASVFPWLAVLLIPAAVAIVLLLLMDGKNGTTVDSESITL